MRKLVIGMAMASTALTSPALADAARALALAVSLGVDAPTPAQD
mgnify:CR=1 FL=1